MKINGHQWRRKSPKLKWPYRQASMRTPSVISTIPLKSPLERGRSGEPLAMGVTVPALVSVPESAALDMDWKAAHRPAVVAEDMATKKCAHPLEREKRPKELHQSR